MTIVAGSLIAAYYAYWISASLFCFHDAREKLRVGLLGYLNYNIYNVTFFCRFCLSLASKSQAAYSELRESGIL